MEIESCQVPTLRNKKIKRKLTKEIRTKLRKTIIKTLGHALKELEEMKMIEIKVLQQLEN